MPEPDGFPRPDLARLADDPALHRAVFAGLGHGVVVLSEDGFVLDANEAHLRQIGRRREELVGQFSPVYTHPDDLEDLLPKMLGLFTGERHEVRASYRFIHGSGEMTRCCITARRVALDDGRHVVAVAYEPDDSAGGLLPDPAELDDLPLSLFFGRSAFLLHDLDGTVVSASASAASLLGRPQHDLAGLTLTDPAFDAVLPDGRPFGYDGDPVAVAADNGVASVDVVGLRRPDGTRAWVSLECALTPLRGGKSVVTSLTDVTAIARAHEERSRLASVLDVAVDLVATFGCDGECRFLNASAREKLGVEAAAVRFEDLATDATRRLVEGEVRPALERAGRWSGELELVAPDRVLPLAATVIAEVDELDDAHPLTGWTLVGHDLTRRKALEAELAHQATHDQLTGLANRSLLSARLRDVDRSGAPVTVVFVDLHGFKEVNDRHGHLVGDQALVAVAERLSDVVGSEGFVARYGGDEFVVLPPPGWVDPADELGRRVFAEPFAVEGLRLAVGAGIGVARSAAGERAEHVLSRADAEMYRTKQR